MDFVRKLVRGSPAVVGSQGQTSHSLGLVTLRRQFRDLCFSRVPLTPAEQEEKLYTILPLFYKVFQNTPAQDMREKFGDVLQFSTQVSRLMVSEIRKRASNKSTEQASVDIAQFLMPHSSESSSPGWMLLNTLSLLAAGGQSIVDCMTTMHLPSTLVKCLYIFFDLPADENTLSIDKPLNTEEKLCSTDSNIETLVSRSNDVNFNSSTENKQDLLQKIFVQTLVRLGVYISPAEELSSKDDLALVFSAVTSWCSPHNKKWRSAASEVLITISRHGLSHNVVQYIRSKQCIKTCINNLWRASVSLEENPAVIVDVDLAEQLHCILRFISNTSEVTQLLLDDFRQYQGYIFVGEFILRLEGAATQSDVHYKALLSVIGAVEKLTTCGFNEIIPDPVIKSSFQNDFVTPIPLGKGESVRNIQAFHVLETLFTRSRTTHLARAVLDAVFAVYCRDPANYFILESLNTISSFSEKLSSKNSEILPQYFAIFEYISLTLGYIPRKELVSISLLLKTDSNLECGIACLKSLLKLMASNFKVYKDVFREVGVLEMLINCLHRYGAMLKAVDMSHDQSQYEAKNEVFDKCHHEFGALTMDILVEMIQGSFTNAGIFRELGGARCAFNTISYEQCRSSALSLVEALILQPAAESNDDDMGTLLGILSTLSRDKLQLKIDILLSLCKVVQKSKDSRAMFRNVGGFINLISIFVSMEGCLSNLPDLWSHMISDVRVLLKVTMQILAVTLQSPVNELYFETEIGYGSFISAVKGLGCFSQTVNFPTAPEMEQVDKPDCLMTSLADHSFPFQKRQDANSLENIIYIFKLIYMVACDSFKDEVQSKIEKLQHSTSKSSDLSDDSPVSLRYDICASYIQHPEMVKAILELLTCISCTSLQKKDVFTVQYYLLEEINFILNLERNEQIMSEVGMLSTLLIFFEDVLVDDSHPLNPSCQRLLERLARQAVSPQELRKMLRLGKPLHCKDLLMKNGVVSLSRVKTLVSIATPRNISVSNDVSSGYKPLPAFVEFDLSVQGSSHLFIPNIFPQPARSQSTVGAPVASDERVFPPAHGISISAWIYIESFCSLQLHPVRILTLERQVITTQQSFTCLYIHISPNHRKLVVSTNELDVLGFGTGSHDVEDSKAIAAFSIEHLCIEGQWHHLQITLQRSTVLKHSNITAVFNGSLLGVSKVRYIHNNPGGSSQQTLNSPFAVHAWVGTPSQFSIRSSLVWRLASLRVFDEVSSFAFNTASIQYNLGPEYTGNYQNVTLQDGSCGPLFTEEHLCFSLLPSSREVVSFATIKRSPRSFDQKQLSIKLGYDKDDQNAPLDFYANACVHAPGAARSIGAFAVGRKYKDAPRCFVPDSIGCVLQDVGGISVALELVAMASDVEGLYAAVKFLACVLKSDDRAMQEMEKGKGYQALGMHLKEKKNLLNTHILHLAFSLAGTIDQGQDSETIVYNSPAFEYLLSDLELWHNAPEEIHKSLFDHFYELLTDSSDIKASHELMCGFEMVQNCVNFIYSDTSLSLSTITSVLKVVQAIFNIDVHSSDLVCLGQFAVSLITPSTVSENEIVRSDAISNFSENPQYPLIFDSTDYKRIIHLRNLILQLFLKCIQQDSKQGTIFCEKIELHLGFDWILLFLQSHLHYSTVRTSLHLLFTALQCSYQLSIPSSSATMSTPASLPTTSLPSYSPALSLIDRFRSGEKFGGWLKGTDIMLDKKEESLLGFNVRTVNDFPGGRCHPTVCRDAVPVPGFLSLQHLMSYHANCNEVLELLIRFAVAQYQSKSDMDFNVDSIKVFLSKHQSLLDSKEKQLSSEVLQILCVMLRQNLHQNWKMADKSSWILTYPPIIIETFEQLYDNDTTQLFSVFMTSSLITALAVTLFPPDQIISCSMTDQSSLQPSMQDLLNQSGQHSDDKLSDHPSSKAVIQLIGKILWDSLTTNKNKANISVIDMLFEISVEKCSASCHKEYITDIILHFIEPYTLSNIEENVKSYHSATNITYLASRIVDKVWQNMFTDDCKKIFYFIAKLIALCQNKPSVHALTSLYRSLVRLMLHQLSRRHSSISEQMVVLDALHCLTTNRNVVFGAKFRDPMFLSCLCHCLFMISGDSGGQEFGIEAEQRLTTWHVPDIQKKSSTSSVTDEIPQEYMLGTPNTPQAKGQKLLTNASARLWSELVSSKKDILAEIFKISFHDLGSEQSNLDSARVQIREAAAKTWAVYITLEKKGAVGDPKDSPQQQKLMKRMSTVVLGGTRKQKKELPSKLGKNITIQDRHLWTLNHISVVQSLVRLQYDEHEQEQNHLTKYAKKEWEQMSAELTRERGVWGPANEENLTKWTLDSTEGPCRMRKRMMRDEMFYIRYPHRMQIQLESTLSKHKKPTSQDSWEFYRRINYLSPYFDGDNQRSEKCVDKEPEARQSTEEDISEKDSSASDTVEDEAVILNVCLNCQPNQTETSTKIHTLSGREAVACDICGLTFEHKNQEGQTNEDANSEINTNPEQSTTNNNEPQSKVPEQNGATLKHASDMVTSDSLSSIPDQTAQEKDKHDNQTILKLLETGEKIRHMFRSARVQGLDVHEGLLLFGQDHYYIIDGFTMLKSREIRDISSLPGEHEPIIPSASLPNQDSVKNDSSFSDRMCSKFSYDDIREVHKRRYLLQNIALEVFNKDGSNCLLVFPQGTRVKVYNKFLSFAKTLSDGGKDSISGQRSGLSVEQQGPALLSNFIGEKTVTSRWERGEINNFQYLMHLNTLAGRSYNDLMQYPVFPWIVADYTSEVLDLTNPATFRDLSKPMGAQTPSRLEQYKKRYRDWDELGGVDTPPYHYGTHYSSAMIVASYLVRMEPFTQHFLRLQGGHFDLADRMFHSIKDSWISASQKNMADVKELIPEFFYLPEFLLNTNRFDLGQKQNGVKLDDVVLPPWARGSPHEFIRAHREALECDYVSSHLHEWIDLIFGYKQKGETALEDYNVFHHLFYEGEVDIYSIKDPLKRNATIGFINNFGQIPKQLFKRPHPQKKLRSDQSASTGISPVDKAFYHHIELLSCNPSPIKELHGVVGHIIPHDRGVFATERGKMLIPPQNSRCISWGHKDLSVRVGYYESERAMQIFENLGCAEVVCATMATERLLITGDKSTVVRVWEIPTVKDRNKTMALVKTLYGHTKAVTSVGSCASYGIIVSGSEDGSCILWDLNHLVFVRQLQHSNDAPISHLCINEKTGNIITCSGTNFYLWSINGQLIAFASALSSNFRQQNITTVSSSCLNEWDADSVIATGHSDGYVRFWCLEHFQVPETDEVDDLRCYSNTGKKNPTMINHVMSENLSCDSVSLSSIGEVTELPWNDVSKVEVVEKNVQPGAAASKSHEVSSNEKDASSKLTVEQKSSNSSHIGFKWKQQLVLKGKVEVPLYKDKCGNLTQSSVTYIAMSKDHEKIFIGDEHGRVYVWTCS
ncbi:unnamed protein product [Clavelina lepadiformis]|uniref:Uncharacterized protein n=1 Tax=Clavelina lepadiformis TaxID=159417 RepID=A0ABP0GYH2_CLALP